MSCKPAGTVSVVKRTCGWWCLMMSSSAANGLVPLLCHLAVPTLQERIHCPNSRANPSMQRPAAGTRLRGHGTSTSSSRYDRVSPAMRCPNIIPVDRELGYRQRGPAPRRRCIDGGVSGGRLPCGVSPSDLFPLAWFDHEHRSTLLSSLESCPCPTMMKTEAATLTTRTARAR